MNVSFTVFGEPVAKGRPRMTKHGHTYTPEKTVNYENLVRFSYIDKHAGSIQEGQLKATIKAYFTIPASTSKIKKTKMLDGEIRPAKKPDVDNIAKIILDSLNGVAYTDDKQVIELSISKQYSDIPRVEITLEQLNYTRR